MTAMLETNEGEQMESEVFQLENKTKKLVENFYQCNMKKVLEILHKDVVWIGAAQGQYLIGYDRVAGYFRKVNQEACQVVHLEYQVILAEEELAIVLGQYYLSADKIKGELLAFRQKITAIWKKEGGRKKVFHFHMSDNIEFQKKNEIFPHCLGKEISEYVNRMTVAKKKEKKYYLRDHQNCIHIRRDLDIFYIESRKNYMVWHCRNGSIVTVNTIAAVEKELSDLFLRIHKSFIINTSYVVRIQRCFVEMANGDQIQIPVKRYCEVKKKLIGD